MSERFGERARWLAVYGLRCTARGSHRAHHRSPPWPQITTRIVAFHAAQQSRCLSPSAARAPISVGPHINELRDFHLINEHAAELATPMARESSRRAAYQSARLDSRQRRSFTIVVSNARALASASLAPFRRRRTSACASERAKGGGCRRGR